MDKGVRMIEGVPHLIPAYGIDYRSWSSVVADFDEQSDFLFDGRPINKSQLIEAGVRQVNIRYDQKRKVNILEIT